MQSPYIFDSICSRSPQGAVRVGKKVTVSVRLLRTKLHSATLSVFFEADGRKEVLPMEWENLEDGYDCYVGVVDTKNAVGLIWCEVHAKDYDGNAICVAGGIQISVFE